MEFPVGKKNVAPRGDLLTSKSELKPVRVGWHPGVRRAVGTLASSLQSNNPLQGVLHEAEKRSPPFQFKNIPQGAARPAQHDAGPVPGGSRLPTASSAKSAANNGAQVAAAETADSQGGSPSTSRSLPRTLDLTVRTLAASSGAGPTEQLPGHQSLDAVPLPEVPLPSEGVDGQSFVPNVLPRLAGLTKSQIANALAAAVDASYSWMDGLPDKGIVYAGGLWDILTASGFEVLISDTQLAALIGTIDNGYGRVGAQSVRAWIEEGTLKFDNGRIAVDFDASATPPPEVPPPSQGVDGQSFIPNVLPPLAGLTTSQKADAIAAAIDASYRWTDGSADKGSVYPEGLRDILRASGCEVLISDDQLALLVGSHSVVGAEQVRALINEGAIWFDGGRAIADFAASDSVIATIARWGIARVGTDGFIDGTQLGAALESVGLDASGIRPDLFAQIAAQGLIGEGQPSEGDLVSLIERGILQLNNGTVIAHLDTAWIGAWVGHLVGARVANFGAPSPSLHSELVAASTAIGYTTSELSPVALGLALRAYGKGPMTPILMERLINLGVIQFDTATHTVSIDPLHSSALVQRLAEEVLANGTLDDRFLSASELRQGLSAAGFRVDIEDEALNALLLRYSGDGTPVVGLRELTTMLRDGQLKIDGGTVTHTGVPQATLSASDLMGGADTINRATLLTQLTKAGHSIDQVPHRVFDRLIAAYGQRGDGLLTEGELDRAIDDGVLSVDAKGAVVIKRENIGDASVDYTAARIVMGTNGTDHASADQLSAGLSLAGYSVNATAADLRRLIEAYGGADNAGTIDTATLQQAIAGGALVLSSSGSVTVDLSRVKERRTLFSTATIENGDTFAVHHKGGIWSDGSRKNVVEPVIARTDLLRTSTEFAQQLSEGRTVKDLIGTAPSADDAAAMKDAFEMLGISNRQIAEYTKQASLAGADQVWVDGDHGSAWLESLQSAGRMRMATDAQGAQTMETYFYEAAAIDHGGELAGEFSTAGMVHAVETGTADSGKFPWYHLRSSHQAARDLILGAGFMFGSDKAMFPGVSTVTAAERVQQGRELLRSTDIELELTGSKAVNDTAKSIIQKGSSDDPYVGLSELIKGLKGSGIRVDTVTERNLVLLVGAYDGINDRFLDQTQLQQALLDGALVITDDVASVDLRNPKLMEEIARKVIGVGDGGENPSASLIEIVKGLEGMGLKVDAATRTVLLSMIDAYDDIPPEKLTRHQLVAALLDQAMGFNGDTVVVNSAAFPTVTTESKSLWDRVSHLPAELAAAVARGEHSVQEAITKMTDALVLEATAVEGGLHDAMQAVESKISELSRGVETYFGKLENEAFDQLWALQTGGNTTQPDGLALDSSADALKLTSNSGPRTDSSVSRQLTESDTDSTKKTSSLSVSGDVGVGAYAQIRVAGKAEGAINGLDLSGNVRATLPLSSAGVGSVSYPGKKREVKLTLTGELDLGKGDSKIGLTGGVELAFAVTIQEGGAVRLDSVTLNGIADLNIVKVAEELMKRFNKSTPKPSAVAVERNPGEINSEEAEAAFGRFKNQQEKWTPALEKIVEGIEGEEVPAGLVTYAPVTTFEGALTLAWVNSDLGKEDPSFRAGWHHNGPGAPDLFAVSAKAFGGEKLRVGVDAINAEIRGYIMATAGFGLSFSDAGRKSFGKALGDWSA